MSGANEKAKGIGNKAAGNIKQAIGKVLGDTNLQAEGRAQEIKGEAQRKAGEEASEAADRLDRKLGDRS